MKRSSMSRKRLEDLEDFLGIDALELLEKIWRADKRMQRDRVGSNLFEIEMGKAPVEIVIFDKRYLPPRKREEELR